MQKEDRYEGRPAGYDKERKARAEGFLRGLRHHGLLHLGSEKK